MGIVYRVHALRRMLERGIDEGSVRSAIESGDVISSYPDDTPYPTSVFLGGRRGRPLHGVAAYNRADDRWCTRANSISFPSSSKRPDTTDGIDETH